MVDKATVVDALARCMRTEADGVRAMATAAYDEATNAESKAENKYDTRSLEASYLAAGQARRLASVERVATWFEKLEVGACEVVGVGALVEIHERGRRRWCFMAPEGGGTRVEIDGVTIGVITPASPLGEALLGAEAGEEMEVELPGLPIVEVCTVL